MRILYLDLDTLRADHLGCYGYARDTSPNLDAIAREGVRFENCYASDAPCLPSRSSLFQCRFGVHTGVVNHGGAAADPFPEGYPSRQFRFAGERLGWMGRLHEAGLHTASISPFAERHSAWWFYEGFSEMHNTGKTGDEIAADVAPVALDWIRRNAKRDNWFLQVNFWDAHTPYRTPADYGNPFEGSPVPAWYTEEIRRAHWNGWGMRSAQEPHDFRDANTCPRMSDRIASLDDFRRWIDGYDTGIRYMDDHIGLLLAELRRQGVYDDLVILVSSDHGENLGELNVYGDHQTADYCTSRVPLVMRWPRIAKPGVDRALHYACDMAATVTELAGGKCSPRWDARSFAEAFRAGRASGREFLVVSQCAWSCQRSVRFGDFIAIRTYDPGLKDFPEWMLFDVKADPHETRNLAASHPQIVERAAKLLDAWLAEMMRTSVSGIDPLWTVIREGGPAHTLGDEKAYAAYLRRTGRAHHADTIEKRGLVPR